MLPPTKRRQPTLFLEAQFIHGPVAAAAAGRRLLIVQLQQLQQLQPQPQPQPFTLTSLQLAQSAAAPFVSASTFHQSQP